MLTFLTYGKRPAAPVWHGCPWGDIGHGGPIRAGGRAYNIRVCAWGIIISIAIIAALQNMIVYSAY